MCHSKFVTSKGKIYLKVKNSFNEKKDKRYKHPVILVAYNLNLSVDLHTPQIQTDKLCTISFAKKSMKIFSFTKKSLHL